MDDLNKTTPQDIAYAATKAAVGSVPIVGAAASEILGLIVTAPLEKRRNKLLTEIGERLKALEEASRLDLGTLADNQLFLDTVLQATTYALKTSEEEKISAFKNAIINTALNQTPDETVSQIFLNLLDNFTSWHIRILDLFNNPEEWFKTHNRTFPNYTSAGLSTVLGHAYPELKEQNELSNIIWGDLKRAGLHNSGDTLGGTMTASGLMSQRTTDMGRRFLRYIKESQ